MASAGRIIFGSEEALVGKPSDKGCLVGLIGQGIGKSLTPAMHMKEGVEHGLPYIYRLTDLAVLNHSIDDLSHLLNAAIDLGYQGLNITYPGKQAIIPLLDEVDPTAEAIGAVNTVRIADGRTKGFNTDAYGFASGIKREIGDITGHKVVQLGAGGAGAATAAAALDLGIGHIVLTDVDRARADQLAQRLQARFGQARASSSADVAAALSGADGLIHATPTGMAAYPGLPLDAALVQGAR